MPSNDIGDILNPVTPGKSDKEESSDTPKLKIEALIDYIATTPQNINYNILREIIKATVSNKSHPYFDYYQEKIGQTEESPSEEPSEPNPDDGGNVTK